MMRKNIANNFSADFKAEVSRIVTRNDNRYINYLVYELKDKKIPNIRRLFEYGISNLPNREKHHIDNDLSTYFMLISEMKDLPDKLYDFGYDLMTYCEHGPKFDFLWAVEFRDKNWSPTNHLESILKECKV